ARAGGRQHRWRHHPVRAGPRAPHPQLAPLGATGCGAMRLTSIGSQLLMTIALPVILLALWWVVSADNTSPFWPSLQKILQAFPDTWTSDRVMEDIVPSLARLALGYALALLVGVGLGTVIGLSRPVRAFLEPALEFLRAIPPPVIIPVIALFVGYSGWTSKIIAIALG